MGSSRPSAFGRRALEADWGGGHPFEITSATSRSRGAPSLLTPGPALLGSPALNTSNRRLENPIRRPFPAPPQSACPLSPRRQHSVDDFHDSQPLKRVDEVSVAAASCARPSVLPTARSCRPASFTSRPHLAPPATSSNVSAACSRLRAVMSRYAATRSCAAPSLDARVTTAGSPRMANRAATIDRQARWPRRTGSGSCVAAQTARPFPSHFRRTRQPAQSVSTTSLDAPPYSPRSRPQPQIRQSSCRTRTLAAKSPDTSSRTEVPSSPSPQ